MPPHLVEAISKGLELLSAGESCGQGRAAIAVLVLALLLMSSCDRNLEPFDPAEEPRQPDLSKIFPAGADQAAEQTPGGQSPGPGRGAPPVASAASPLSGTVDLSPELRDRVPPGAILFLIARRDQPGPPLAVQRIRAPSFPLEFEIGPEDRMIQQMPFDGPLRLSARLDGDGNATTRQPGDLHGEAPETVEPGASGIEITIDQVISP